MKRVKCILSMFLCASLCFFLCLSQAYAEEGGPENSEPEPAAEYAEVVSTDPAYEETVHEEPVSEPEPGPETALGEPVYEEPTYEEPVHEEPAYEESKDTPYVPAEPVRIFFDISVENADLCVFFMDEYGCRREIDAAEDGSFLLVPGQYYYTIHAEGFTDLEETALTVEASDKPVTVMVTMEEITPEPLSLLEGTVYSEAKNNRAELGEEPRPLPASLVSYPEGNDTDQADLLNRYIGSMLEEANPQWWEKQEAAVSSAPGGMLKLPRDPKAGFNAGQKELYDLLINEIRSTASNGGASVYTITLSQPQSWTAEELGFPSFEGNESDAIRSAVGTPVLNALLYSLPYELYWFDKVNGVPMTATGNFLDSTLTISSVTYSFTVAQQYSTGDKYTVDASAAETTKNAIRKAQSIADGAAGSSFEILDSFRRQICALTSYNWDAVESEDTPYGNAWQIIWVFDEDENTGVVCEGYSKAFEYLCDLAFPGAGPAVRCYIATGTMRVYDAGNAHMWNIVSMDDGKNYLVDLTNCDSGSIGADDLLFLKGCKGGSAGAGYVFQGADGTAIEYVYDDDTWSTYSNNAYNELTLSATDYNSSSSGKSYDVEVRFLDIIYGTTAQIYIVDANTRERTEYRGSLIWSVVDPDIAMVNTAGIITPVKVGSTLVTVRSENGDLDTDCQVFVRFSDVTNPDDFFYEPIYQMVSYGVIGGWADGTFHPVDPCNRAAVVTFLWRLAGRPEPSGMAAFTDMPGDNIEFQKAISWAAENEITTGFVDGTFRPWDDCNRAAIVTFLWRYAGRPEPSGMAAFTDMPGDNIDFQKAISWAAENGITTGWNDGTFRPWENCARLAVASFLSRYEKLL